MSKIFNVTADCKPEKHYMVKLDKRLQEIRKLVDVGDYFTINRARQYGKTTTLRALNRCLQKDYYVVLMDFQTFGAGEFEDENTFALTFAESFLWEFYQNKLSSLESLDHAINLLEEDIRTAQLNFRLRRLFVRLRDICASSDKRIVLMIDEVDSATNNQVFLDFLAQLRAGYINRDKQITFQSVILAGVYDVKNLRRKLRQEEEHKVNSPWNIATDFKVDMSFSEEEIAGMLQEYMEDNSFYVDINEIAKLLYDYTQGYPYLVSRLCKLMDEEVCKRSGFETREYAWSKAGFLEAMKMILAEKNTLFESLSEKLISYPELNDMLCSVLFTGKTITYNYYEPSINIATMFGFVKEKNNSMVIANRIFETWLYNYYLSAAEMHKEEMYTASLRDKNQFVVNGYLNVRLILERFVVHFNELYGDNDAAFLEEEGRKYFLLYLRPIINGTGNYYIESRTRELKRTDVIIDYCGEQYIIEMKIWHGNEYNTRGEKQLIGYLDDYHQKKGYMISFNFNKNKCPGVKEIVIDDKTIIEAVV